MTAWRDENSWGKAWTYALLALAVVFTCCTDASWPENGSSNRKRVFSPGFVVFCVFVAVIELTALNHFYGVRR